MLRSRVEWAHSALRLNGHYNTDGSVDETKVNDTIVIDERIFDPAFRDTRESYHLAQGGAAGRSHKGAGAWRLRGRILVPDATQLASLSDQERALRAAFDPYQCELDSPTTDGVYGLTWSEPTTDTGTWVGGLIPLRAYVKPIRQPSLLERNNQQTERPWSVDLSAPDPRIYGQTEQTLNLTPASASQAANNRGTTGAPWRATITMSGAGSSAFRLDRIGDTPGPIELNLSATVNTDVIVIYGETCGPYGRGRRITKNGVDTFSLKTSGADTWFVLPTGSTTITMTNHTNVTSCVFAWYHAWA